MALSTPPQHPVAPASPGPSREPRRGRSAACLALLFPIRFLGSPMTHPSPEQSGTGGVEAKEEAEREEEAGSWV